MIAERLMVNGTTYEVRSARREDIPAIVTLLADDVLGRGRESSDADLAPYMQAFDTMERHANQELVVVEREGAVVGTFDLAILASLSRRGSLRMQVEAVRVARSERGSGLGAAIFRWIVDHARARGCTLVQLASDRARADAHRFYERLGFTASHLGYKLAVSPG